MNKVKIYTLANMTPDFLYQQYESMKKFIKDDNWEFIVLNNTPITAFKRRAAIKKICKELGIKCLDVRFRSFTSGIAYIVGWSLTWAYHRLFRWEKDTIHCVIDSDMFFIKEFSFNESLADNDVCAIHQRREHIDYLWNGFYFMKGAALPDKNHLDFRLTTDKDVRTDAAGRTYYWFKRNPELKIKWLNHTCHNDVSKSNLIPEPLREDYKPEYNFQFIEDFILHSRGGSNWSKDSNNFVNDKNIYLKKFMSEIIDNNVRINEAPELYMCKE